MIKSVTIEKCLKTRLGRSWNRCPCGQTADKMLFKHWLQDCIIYEWGPWSFIKSLTLCL